MDPILLTRYETFKQFIKTIPNIDDSYVSALNQAPIQLFLFGINSDELTHMDVDQLTTHIATKAKFNLNEVSEVDIKRFKSYISYFKEISNNI